MPQAATIGRVVWVWLEENSDYLDDDTVLDDNQPFRADVIFVAEDGRVHLNVVAHNGAIFDLTVGPVRDPEDGAHHSHAGEGPYASWMPYQKAQHDKQAAG